MVRLSTFLARIPMIKFRKGGYGMAATGGHSAIPGAASTPNPNASSGQTMQGSRISTSINDFELPKRYQRRPISEEEIMAINSGGIL